MEGIAIAHTRFAQDTLLDCYERIAAATRRMLDAARAADWPALDENRRDCETWMRRVEHLPDADEVLDAEGRRRRMSLLRQVLQDDRALRDLLDPTLGRVDRFLRHAPRLEGRA